MTELEWCKANAPEALKTLPDAQLVEMMHSSYVRYCDDRLPSIELDTFGLDLTDKQQRLTHLVLTAVNVLHDKVALKGGFLLSHILGNRGRMTRDVDLDVIDQKAYDYLIPTLRALGDYYINSGLATDYKIREDLSGDKSGGFIVYSGNTQFLKCDICSMNLSYGLTFTSIEGKDIQSFSPDRILADKILALLSVKRFRRAKDIYDVYCLTDLFKCNAQTINIYMRNTVTETKGLWDEFPYTVDILIRMEQAYNKLTLLNLSGETIPKPNWQKVADRFTVFARKVKEPYAPFIWDNEKGLYV